MEKGKKCGCGCKSNIKKEVEKIVKDVEGYTKEDHAKKQGEVKAAFTKKEGPKK